MSQMDDKKSVDVMRRKTQISATKNRRAVERPAKTFIIQRKDERTSPVILKKQEIRIMPTAQEDAYASVVKSASSSIKNTKVKQSSQQKTSQQGLAMQQSMQQSMRPQQSVVQDRMTSAQIKEEAIEKAMQATVSEQQAQQKTKRRSMGQQYKVHFGFKRLVLALACATAAVFAIVYFVNLNKPDIALRVAAIQNGIDASYPKFTPRGFTLTDITSENGKITLNFKDSTAENTYSIIEEKKSWDSNALLSNYVKQNYKDDYTVIKEQGLTLYVSNNETCWVNGGVLYKLKITSGSLTKKQIKTIATSL